MLQALASKKKRHIGLLFLIIISLPFSIKINSILIILLVINSLIKDKEIIYQPLTNLPLLLVSSPFVLSLLALIYSDNLDQGIFILEKSLPLVAFPLVFSLSSRLKPGIFEKITFLFPMVIVIVAIICFTHSIWLIISNNSLIDQSKLSDREYYYFTYYHLAGAVHMNPIYLGMYTNFAISLVLERLLKQKSKTLLVMFVFLTLFLFMLSSKINIIIYFILLITFIFHFRKKVRFVYRYGFILATFSILIVFFVKPIKDRVININYLNYDIERGHISFWNGANLRLAIWECAKAPILNNWLLGVGTGDEKKELMDSYAVKKFNIGLLTKYNTHNQMLQFCLRFGILAAIFVMITNFLIPIIVGYRWDYGLYIFSIIVFINSLTEVIFATQKGVVFYSLFVTLFLHNRSSKSPK